ncbi:MAG TPA: histidine kinase [Actinomycetota bacterium]|nr:histidine kinase [Actinomycetota bacterium]
MTQRTAARLAWTIWGLAVALALVALVIIVMDQALIREVEAAIYAAIFMAMGAVGALVLGRQPRNAVGWILLAVAVAAALAFGGDAYGRHATFVDPGSLPGVAWAWWVSDSTWVAILALPTTFLLLLFPDGRLPSRRWRPFLWAITGFVSVAVVAFALDPATYPGGYSNPVGVEALAPLARFIEGPGYALLLAAAVVSAISLIFRYRRADRQQRLQIKWFGYAVSLLVVYFLIDGLITALHVRPSAWVTTIASAAAFGSLPVGLAISILRYRLYDIDVVINRTVLFGLLAAFITAIYVGIVIGIGSMVGGRGNVFLSIAATAIVAVAFQPITARARHFANRLVYGKRATPYEVLSTFSDHLGEAYSPDDILPRIARMIGEATGAERATVWVRVGGDLRPSGSWPEGDGRPAIPARGDSLPAFPAGERAFPVRHQGELLGALSVVTSRREPLNETQERLLEDLAGQAGLVLRNVRLIEELRASRQRLVAAQDEERRRLERNIHDGAQQQLVALAVKIRLARTIAGRDVEKAQGLLDELQGETQEALENLRDLARGIYPPLLADKGLAAALEAQARKVPFPVRVEPNGVGRYPAEAEATAYFCVLEALQNSAKYAEPSRAVVRLSHDDGHLVFTVTDDGRGFDPATTPRGSGLQNMADRLEAIGGSVEVTSTPGRGTAITGRIPVGRP